MTDGPALNGKISFILNYIRQVGYAKEQCKEEAKEGVEPLPGSRADSMLMVEFSRAG